MTLTLLFFDKKVVGRILIAIPVVFLLSLKINSSFCYSFTTEFFSISCIKFLAISFEEKDTNCI